MFSYLSMTMPIPYRGYHMIMKDSASADLCYDTKYVFLKEEIKLNIFFLNQEESTLCTVAQV